MPQGRIGIGALDSRYESKHLYNVRDYGAKGDGSSDDTAAVLAAVAAAETSDVILFPHSGDAYILSSAIANGKNLRFRGDGSGSKIYMSADEDMFTCTAAGVFEFRDLWLGSAATSTGKSIIKASNPASFGTIEGVLLEGGYYGIALYGSTFCTIRSPMTTTDFPETTSQAQATIYAIYSGKACNALTVINPRFQGGTTKSTHGIYIDNQQGEGTFSVIGGLIEGYPNGDGIYALACRQGAAISGVHFESNSKGIHMESCKNFTITGCYLTGVPSIHLDACSAFRVSECYLKSPQIDDDCETGVFENIWYETACAIQGSMMQCRNVRSNNDSGNFGIYGYYEPAMDTVNRVNANGDLEVWTASVPDGYSVHGTVGQESTTIRSGSSSAKLTASGSGWNALQYDLDAYKHELYRKPISVQAWVYRPAASGGTSPRIQVSYSGGGGGGWARTFTVDADTWTPICCTINVPPSASYTGIDVKVGTWNATGGDVLYVDDITISEVQF